MNLDPKFSMADILRAAQNEKAKVKVHLRSGFILFGRVGEVADHHLLLTHIDTRDFFDAVIRIEEIAAIEAQARTS
jgi:sRNA-binding regulator protein Hfq